MLGQRPQRLGPGLKHTQPILFLFFFAKVPNALRVSRAAFSPKYASIRSTLHNQFSRTVSGRDSGVGLHALVRPMNGLDIPAICPERPIVACHFDALYLVLLLSSLDGTFCELLNR